MRNELLKWAEENRKAHIIMHSDKYTVFSQLIDKINSIPVPDVEGYLEGKVIDIHNAGGFVEHQHVELADALSALQSPAADKEREVQEWFNIAHDEMAKVSELQSEVESLKKELNDEQQSISQELLREMHLNKRLTAEVERLKGVLGDLVELKRWKYKHGADEAYLKNRDAVWIRAFELIPEPPKQ